MRVFYGDASGVVRRRSCDSIGSRRQACHGGGTEFGGSSQQGSHACRASGKGGRKRIEGGQPCADRHRGQARCDKVRGRSVRSGSCAEIRWRTSGGESRGRVPHRGARLRQYFPCAVTASRNPDGSPGFPAACRPRHRGGAQAGTSHHLPEAICVAGFYLPGSHHCGGKHRHDAVGGLHAAGQRERLPPSDTDDAGEPSPATAGHGADGATTPGNSQAQSPFRWTIWREAPSGAHRRRNLGPRRPEGSSQVTATDGGDLAADRRPGADRRGVAR